MRDQTDGRLILASRPSDSLIRTLHVVLFRKRITDSEESISVFWFFLRPRLPQGYLEPPQALQRPQMRFARRS